VSRCVYHCVCFCVSTSCDPINSGTYHVAMLRGQSASAHLPRGRGYRKPRATPLNDAYTTTCPVHGVTYLSARRQHHNDSNYVSSSSSIICRLITSLFAGSRTQGLAHLQYGPLTVFNNQLYSSKNSIASQTKKKEKKTNSPMTVDNIRNIAKKWEIFFKI